MESTLLSELSSDAIFQSGVVLTLSLVGWYAILLIASMTQSGATIKGASQAIYCMMMEILGILLMTVGAIPTIYSVLSGFAYEGTTYVALLILFTAGGAIFLWHDQLLEEVQTASKTVAATIYTYLLRTVGTVLSLMAVLSLILGIVLGAGMDGWVMPLIMLAYGLLLMWSTQEDTPGGALFQSTKIVTSMPKPVMPTPKAIASATRKPAAVVKKRAPAKKKKTPAKKAASKKPAAKKKAARPPIKRKKKR